jgi:hypothetical protein
VDKPWVKAELNTGVVRRIEGHSRLIPIIIGSVDDALIPESLRDTPWRRIRDLDDYDAEFESIVRSIYGQRDRPKLGETPAYARLAMDTIPGLGEVDSLILKLCCEELIRTADSVTAGIHPQPVLEQAQAKDIHEQDILDTLQILDSRGYIELGKVLGGGIINIKVSDYAFDEYARTFLPDYDEAYRSVALEIVNHGRHNGQDIVRSLNQPSVIVDHILRKMWNSGRIKAQEFAMGLIYIHEATPELKRWLQEM